MMAAVALGVYPDMEACIAQWVVPLLGELETPDPELTQRYARLFPAYRQARQALAPVWEASAGLTQARLQGEALPEGLCASLI